jgi:hypothetical protein
LPSPGPAQLELEHPRFGNPRLVSDHVDLSIEIHRHMHCVLTEFPASYSVAADHGAASSLPALRDRRASSPPAGPERYAAAL